MNDLVREYRALLRQDPVALLQKVFATLDPGTRFEPNWHYEHLCYKLGQVTRGEVRRLIINVPPRSGKSILASVTWPMQLLGEDPTRRLLCISHTESLAREFSLQRRIIAQSPWYQGLYPDMRLASRRPPDLELRTDRRGYIFAAGVGGGILGKGADFIVVDDPLKGLDALSEAARRRVNEFYDNTLLTRLNDKKSGAIVIIMQRLHQDDLVGHLIERDDWDVVSLPAIALADTVHALGPRPGDVYRRTTGELLHASREPLTALEEVKRAQGSLNFQTQYQQDPAPADGNVIRRDWLRYYDERPISLGPIVVSWDTASTTELTSDWSVGTVWAAHGLDFYLLDVVRERLDPTDLRAKILDVSRHWQANTTLIEDTELGRALTVDLKRSGQLAAILHRPLYDKRARLEAQAARFESGQVRLPREAPWLGAYLSELLAFPTGKNDDQVDSTSQALDWMTGKAARAGPIVRRDITRRNIERR